MVCLMRYLMRYKTDRIVTGSASALCGYVRLPPRSCRNAREKADHLSIENRQVFRPATGYQIAVYHARPVFPLAAGIADIILNGWPTCEFAPSHNIRRNQFPGGMTNGRNRKPGAVHL